VPEDPQHQAAGWPPVLANQAGRAERTETGKTRTYKEINHNIRQ